MRAVLGLQVRVRVPVRVEDDDGVGGLEVEPETTGARGEDEDLVGRVLGVEECDGRGALLGLGASVETQVKAMLNICASGRS